MNGKFYPIYTIYFFVRPAKAGTGASSDATPVMSGHSNVIWFISSFDAVPATGTVLVR